MPSAIWIMGWVSLFTDLSGQMIMPILPLYMTTVLHLQVAEVGIVEGVGESVASLLKLYSGLLTDRLGKRKLFMGIGYGLSNLVKPFFAISGTWTQVLLIRFADRFGKGIRVSPRDALIADSASEEERGKAFGFRRAMDALGAALGPLCAFGVLAFAEGNYRLVFWLSAVPGGLAMILLVVFLKDRGSRSPRDRVIGGASRGVQRIGIRQWDRRFVMFTLVFSLFTAANFSDAFLALQAQQVGMKPALIPLAYFAFNLVSSVSSMPVGALSDRIGRRPVLITGLFLFAAIYFGFGMADTVAWIWILFVLYGLYYAFTDGIQKAYIADLVPEGRRGAAMGTFNACTGIAALPASIWAGFAWQTLGSAAAFGISAGVAALAALLILILKI